MLTLLALLANPDFSIAPSWRWPGFSLLPSFCLVPDTLVHLLGLVFAECSGSGAAVSSRVPPRSWRCRRGAGLLLPLLLCANWRVFGFKPEKSSDLALIVLPPSQDS